MQPDGSDGRVVVITGASGGIGAGLARRLGRTGDRLVLAARRGTELALVADESGGALAMVTDVTRRAEVERLRDAALAAFGRIDVWINNAGRGITRPALELTDDDVDDMIATNVKSALYGMQAVAPHFIERNAGHLVNVSSFLGRVPLATVRSAYSAAKAFLNSLTANVRMDLRAAAPGVHVSLVMPGLVATDFASNAGTGGRTPPPTVTRPAGVSLAPQSVDEVVDVIVRLLEHPVPEVYTNPAQPGVVERYLSDVAAFEARLERGA
jgi:NADP-dependent 3-hydroxy acid dehydrogenase YdfG